MRRMMEQGRTWINHASPWALALALFVAAFVLRGAYALALSPQLRFDEPHYIDLASRLLNGLGYSFSSDAYYTAVAGQPTSFQEPLYPALLTATLAVVGETNVVMARLLLALIAACIPVLGFALGTLVGNRAVGLFSGLWLVFQPSLIYFSGLLMTESLFTALLLAVLVLTLWGEGARPLWRTALLGLALAAGVLTRSMMLGVAPIVAVYLWLRLGFQRGLQHAALAAAVVVVCVLPWSVRNTLLHKEFVPFTTKAGYNLYIYAYPVRDFNFNDRWDQIEFPPIAGLSEVQRNDLLAAQGRAFIRENPALFAEFALHKLVDFWNPVAEGAPLPLILANVAAFGVAALLALAGIVLMAFDPRARKPPLYLLYLVVAYYNVQCMIFTGGMKARLPVEPLLVVLAVHTLWIMALRARAGRTAGAPVAS